MLAAIALLLVAASVAGCSAYSSLTRDLPDPTKQLLSKDQTTKVLDRKGRLVANLFAEQNRTTVKLSEMPVALRNAVVATEDERFYQHAGVDPVGIARALWTDITRGRAAQGGSTITQQYVKNAFTTDEASLSRKIREAALAYQVEKRFGKDEILAMYLNTIYFGHASYGVETAAEMYFGKTVAQLDLPESAMLAGVIKSPGRYSPYLDPAAARARRHTVLTQMRDQGYIDASAFQSADASPVRTAGLKGASKEAPYFVEYLKEALVAQFGAQAVYRGGLTVRTTLDLDMQHAAENAVSKTLDRAGDPSASVVALDPSTGEIRAMVGGRDFTTQQFNVAVQGRRQPGSAFKPFVLAAALADGVSPEAMFESGPVSLSVGDGGTAWRVTGADGDRWGPMRLRQATEESVNSVFAQLILQIGPDRVVDVAHKLGITSAVRPLPAIALGGLDEGVSPMEMASAYGTLANDGILAPPHGIAQVSQAGTIRFTAPAAKKRVIPADVAYLTTDILRGVIARGTGTAADIGRDAAGKTGTTQAYRDAWFVGYTPDLVAAVWVGYPDAQREMTSVHGRKVTGGSFPAAIWRRFMAAAVDGTAERSFEEPDGLTREKICLDTGLLATPYCPHTTEGLFLSGAEPKRCTTHARPRLVTVPDVKGMTEAAATAALRKAGFSAKTVYADATGGTSGTVDRQEPAAGKQAPEKSAVTIAVSKAAPAAAPSVTFSFSLSSGGAVSFAPQVTGGTAPYAYAWDFGDGSSSEKRAPRHGYATAPAGRFTVTLTVTDGTGASATESREVVLGKQ